MKDKHHNFLIIWGETIVSFLVALACLSLFYFFPAQGGIQELTRTLFFFALIPSFYVIFILRKKLKDFGFTLPVNRRNASWFLLMLIVSLFFTYLLIRFTSFKESYALPEHALGSFFWFMVYELVFLNIWLFLFEAFFRGFLLRTLSEKFGPLAILVSAFIFTLFLFNAKPISWGSAPILTTAMTGGWLAYKTRSFLYSYLMGLLYIIIIDAYMIYALKQYF